MVLIKKIRIISITVGCLIILSGIFYAVYFFNKDPGIIVETDVPLADDTNATAESVSKLVNSLNEFSFDFYQQIANFEEGNIFFSPYSIFTALSMAYEGARNNTAVEMQNVLNILQNDSPTLGSFGRIYNLLNQNQEGYKISTANAFWAHEDYNFLKEYLGLLENFYMAEANELDFSKNVEAAEIINTWIEEQTNDKIKDMISPDILSDLTKLVLTNAIYFKGLWDSPFDPKLTYESDFELTNGETVKVDMMSKPKDSKFNFTQTEDLQVLEMDYYGNELSMFFILPKENNISFAETSFNLENLSNWKNDLSSIKIDVDIPKFKFETKYSLKSILMDMGIIDAFSPGAADFSGMDGTKNLFISRAIHQAFVEVNEEGTEAAAATTIIVALTAIPDSFIADHPFVFLIQHKETGAILFMGRVTDPSI
ncbi:MAG: serpin family protein [Thermoplasmatales archaeon]|nr:MAG: serpin family protein [Thermoplasmatales archaeon]